MIMKQVVFLAVLTIYCLQDSLADKNIPKRTVFDYEGKIVTRNHASEDHASTWTISGKLFVESTVDEMYTMKLNDVKTRIHNGETWAYENATEKEIPVESEAILNPFVLHREKEGFYISHYPEEPVWSLNMKRSIANIFFLKSDKNTNSEERENTIYGNCKVRYVIKRDNYLTIQKDIDFDSCENGSMYITSNVGWDPTANKHMPVHMKTFRRYLFDDIDELKSVCAVSEIIYQSTPSVRSKQIIHQSQLFEREAIITEFVPINVTKNTVNTDVVFDFSKDISGGRNTADTNKSATELIKDFFDSYEEFKDHFETYPIPHVTTNMNDTLTYMFEALSLMNKNTLADVGKQIFEKDDNLLHHSFASYLPYLGTDASLQYIQDLIKNDDTLNDLLTIKILAILPAHAQNTSEEFIAEMEDLMRLENVKNPQIKYAGLLSFASLVSEAYQKETISSNVANKYASYCMKQFKSKEVAEDLYEVQMTYLLCLINMANVLDKQTIISIISNPNESSHIRALGIYGFKESLKEESEQVYKTFWPIVKNETEPLEVRVASLDLLMYSNLTSENFKSIVSWYHHELSDPSEQHLANYLYTTLESLQNDTGYYEYLGDEATEALKTIKPPKSQRAWFTGNYRMAYTDDDSNFGASIQARMISNPVSNVLNSALITLDDFAIGVNLGVYSMYIKIKGMDDLAIAIYALKEMLKEDAVPKLKELLQQHNFTLKTPGDIYIELVLFRDHKVVYGMHIDEYTIVNYATNPLLLNLVSLVLDYNSISYPVLDYTSIVSDLGTGIVVSKEVIEVASYELINFDKMLHNYKEMTDLFDCELKFRSTWYYSLYTECYNPLIDASIATYKYVGKEMGVHIPYSLNITDFVFKMKNIPDAINYIEDHLIGTMVDKTEILHEYCSSCSQIAEIPVGELNSSEMKMDTLGMYLNVSISEPSIYQTNLHLEDSSLYEMATSFIQNNRGLAVKEPAAQMILLLYYLNNHYTYLDNDLRIISVRTQPIHTEPTEIIFDLDIDTDEINNGKDPILGTVFNASFGYSTRESKTGNELGYMNLDFKYASISKSEGDAAPQMIVKYDFECQYSVSKETGFKVCLHRNEINPSRRSDRYSLLPVEATSAETKIYFGTVYSKNASCSKDNGALFTELYTSTPRLKSLMEAMPEYRNCKIQSHGLKYTPPTDDCFAAHETISKYDAVDIYVEFRVKFLESLEIYLSPTNRTYGANDLSICKINKTHIHVDLNPYYSDPSSTNLTQVELSKCYVGEKLDSIVMNPNSIAYDDNELRYGFESACHITPNRVRTFTENIIKNYYEHSIGDPVAFIECVENYTTHGLTIQRFDNKHVGFTFWSTNNTIVSSVENGKMKIVLNNKQITKTKIISDTFKIYFLESDVIYISTAIVDIFYTTEYITIKIYSGYNNFICGLCAETKHQ